MENFIKKFKEVANLLDEIEGKFNKTVKLIDKCSEKIFLEASQNTGEMREGLEKASKIIEKQKNYVE